jgi:hypothetical protein
MLRVISSHGLGAPVGSLATVKAETSRSGDWVCIVEYHDMRQSAVNTDLGRFEIVTDLARAKNHWTRAQAHGAAVKRLGPQQRALPFAEGLEVETWREDTTKDKLTPSSKPDGLRNTKAFLRMTFWSQKWL